MPEIAAGGLRIRCAFARRQGELWDYYHWRLGVFEGMHVLKDFPRDLSGVPSLINAGRFGRE
jgi:hypothetical protein